MDHRIRVTRLLERRGDRSSNDFRCRASGVCWSDANVKPGGRPAHVAYDPQIDHAQDWDFRVRHRLENTPHPVLTVVLGQYTKAYH
jgi:hypothetical protein